MSDQKELLNDDPEETAIVEREAPAQPTPKDPMAMIASAIDRGMDVETMKEILAMRRELKAEAAREAFFSALSRFQADMPEIPKSKRVMNKKGEHRYSYAPLDQIIRTTQPLLKAHGFSYTMKPVQDEGTQFTAVIIVHHDAGHEEESSFSVPIDTESFMNAPQKVGSARTFAMRYAYCNAFGILTSDEDDDAGAIEINAVLAASEQIASLDTAGNFEELTEIMRGIWKQLPENDARRLVVKSYYNQRKEQMNAGN